MRASGVSTGRRRGRPAIGKGSTRVNFTIERGILREADALTRGNGKRRSELLAEGLRILLKRGAARLKCSTSEFGGKF